MLLDDEKTIERIDAGNVRSSISALPDQIESAWREASLLRLPVSYTRAKNIVVTGMGGSALPAHLVQSVYGGALRVPFCFINGYDLPGSVDKNTVVIVSSYSGTTEETLACLAAARKRKAMVVGITTGGPLAASLKRFNLPAYVFDAVANPCHQPRMGLGYMTTGLLAILDKITDFGLDSADIEKIPARLRKESDRWSIAVPMESNPAKLLAHNLACKVPIVIGAEHLVGNGHIFQNQTHECPKQFCAAFPLPELNHHLMEGLKFPREINQLLSFVFLDSGLYGERITKRVKVTEQVVKRQNYDSHRFKASDRTRLGQAFETLAFGSWVSFYLAMQSRINPSDIPWVDFFKKELGKG